MLKSLKFQLRIIAYRPGGSSSYLLCLRLFVKKADKFYKSLKGDISNRIHFAAKPIEPLPFRPPFDSRPIYHTNSYPTARLKTVRRLALK